MLKVGKKRNAIKNKKKSGCGFYFDISKSSLTLPCFTRKGISKKTKTVFSYSFSFFP